MKGWDIIPDIHGQRAKLEALLARLGYREERGAYRHQARKALFLGDYIDRGPDVRGVLRIVRAMVNAGEATALMGNHELNAIHYHTVDRNGHPLRPHTEEKKHQHKATWDQFSGMRGEWAQWLAWFKTLPMFYDTPDFRAVHACWCENSVREVLTDSFREDSFVISTASPDSPKKRAVDLLLKGPEINLPPGVQFEDKERKARSDIRVRWWGLDRPGLTYAEVVMPPGAKAPELEVPPDACHAVPNYPCEAKPVFVGHYWLPWRGQFQPLADNIVCLDHSAGLGGPLVACRWNGTLTDSEFVAVGGAPADASPHMPNCN